VTFGSLESQLGSPLVWTFTIARSGLAIDDGGSAAVAPGAGVWAGPGDAGVGLGGGAAACGVAAGVGAAATGDVGVGVAPAEEALGVVARATRAAGGAGTGVEPFGRTSRVRVCALSV
jgi:hypothetical protein